MKPNQSILRFCLSLLFGALTTLTVAAAEEAVTTAAQLEVKRARLLELKAQAKTMRQNADAAHQQESAECRQTLLVNNCLSRAGDRRLEKVEQARGLESEVSVLEREIRLFELTTRRAERARRLAERKIPTTVNVEGAKETTLPAGAAAGNATPPAGTPAVPERGAKSD